MWSYIMSNSSRLSYSINKGFTLVELLVVVAILSILAMIAIPSYQGSIEKTDLANAKQEMVSIRQALVREKVTSPGSYRTATAHKDFLNRMQQNLPQEITGKYQFVTLDDNSIITEGKIFSFFLQAVPRGKNYKYGLWMDQSGYVFKCPKDSLSASTISMTKPAGCESF